MGPLTAAPVKSRHTWGLEGRRGSSIGAFGGVVGTAERVDAEEERESCGVALLAGGDVVAGGANMVTSWCMEEYWRMTLPCSYVCAWPELTTGSRTRQAVVAAALVHSPRSRRPLACTIVLIDGIPPARRGMRLSGSKCDELASMRSHSPPGWSVGSVQSNRGKGAISAFYQDGRHMAPRVPSISRRRRAGAEPGDVSSLLLVSWIRRGSPNIPTAHPFGPNLGDGISANCAQKPITTTLLEAFGDGFGDKHPRSPQGRGEQEPACSASGTTPAHVPERTTLRPVSLECTPALQQPL